MMATGINMENANTIRGRIFFLCEAGFYFSYLVVVPNLCSCEVALDFSINSFETVHVIANTSAKFSFIFHIKSLSYNRQNNSLQLGPAFGVVKIKYRKPISYIFSKCFEIHFKIFIDIINITGCVFHPVRPDGFNNFCINSINGVIETFIRLDKCFHSMVDFCAICSADSRNITERITCRINVIYRIVYNLYIFCNKSIALFIVIKPLKIVLLHYLFVLLSEPSCRPCSSDKSAYSSRPTTICSPNVPKSFCTKPPVEKSGHAHDDQTAYRAASKTTPTPSLSNPSHTTNMRRFSFARQLGRAA
ncbi:hypothetical protein SAMN04488056_112148 [Cohaesibacter marisflavi]|uniref:Uncharacterized protein n=1 Tax=Cohaesibacter marisflavi TaxID=655353 RepID=A0A1I5JYL6_9HYPH|nr:hypothetical protein SAMN04488056_112148 [Cohaesibacter marisflavi]